MEAQVNQNDGGSVRQLVKRWKRKATRKKKMEAKGGSGEGKKRGTSKRTWNGRAEWLVRVRNSIKWSTPTNKRRDGEKNNKSVVAFTAIYMNNCYLKEPKYSKDPPWLVAK